MVTDGETVLQICSVLTAQTLHCRAREASEHNWEMDAVLPCWEWSPLDGTGWGRGTVALAASRAGMGVTQSLGLAGDCWNELLT